MNWEAIGAVGEVLGAVAVLVTLGYLAVQVRHARSEIRLSVTQNQRAAFRELFLERSRNPTLAEARHKADVAFSPELDSWQALVEKAGLDAPEREALFSYLMAWWIYRTEAIENIEHLTPMQREQFDWGLSSYADGYGGLWYRNFKATRQNENHPAIAYIDRLLAEQPDGLLEVPTH